MDMRYIERSKDHSNKYAVLHQKNWSIRLLEQHYTARGVVTRVIDRQRAAALVCMDIAVVSTDISRRASFAANVSQLALLQSFTPSVRDQAT